MPFVQLTRKGCCEGKRQTQKGEKGKEQLCPEIPQRTKQRREAKKKDCRAESGGKKHIKPQLPAADAAGKGEQPHGEQQRKENVERIGETACRPPMQPQ